MSTKSYEKIVDQIGELKVTELAELIKALKEKFEVEMPTMSAGVAAVAADAPAAAKSEEKSEYKVTLKEAGANKINVIKALRQVTTLGLTEVKKAVDEAPTVIAEAAPKADALKMKQLIEEAGGKVELS